MALVQLQRLEAVVGILEGFWESESAMEMEMELEGSGGSRAMMPS